MTRATTPFGRFSGRRTHHGRPPVRAVWRAGLVLAVLATSLTGLIGPRPAGAVGETLAVSLLQVDGTPAWSADDVAGHDSGPTNGIVRANDNIT